MQKPFFESSGLFGPKEKYRSVKHLDSQLSWFVELCWEEGDPVGYASDAICGVPRVHAGI